MRGRKQSDSSFSFKGERFEGEVYGWKEGEIWVMGKGVLLGMNGGVASETIRQEC